MAIQRLPLVGTVTERKAVTGNQSEQGQDQRFVNCFPENIGTPQGQGMTEDLYLVKRPGLALHNNDNPTSKTARGIFSWNGNLYTVWGNKVHKNGTALSGTLGLSTGRVYFDETGGASSKLLVQEPHASTARLTSITSGDVFTDLNTGDADLPDDQVPGVVQIDTYTTVMTSAGNIHNSSPGIETTWASTDFLNAEIKGDKGIRLARHVNYIVALGAGTIEFFFDNANPTGSPFTRLEGTVSLIGSPSGNTLVNIENQLLFVAENSNGGRYVAQLKGFTPISISNKTVEESLDAEQENITDAYAYSVQIMGHSFYVLTLPTTAKRTWVYDLTEGMWHEWTHNSTYFVGFDSCIHNGDVLIQDRNNGIIYKLDPEVFRDYNAIPIAVMFQTKKFDGGVHHNKFLYRLTVIGDQSAGNSTLSLRYTDDDYQTFSAQRDVDLGSKDPHLTRLGYFKKRAFRGTHIANLPFRIQALELNVRQGHYGI